MAIGNDVRKISRALQANQQIFRMLEKSRGVSERIFDELPTTLLMFDDTGNILKINRECEKTLQIKEHEVLGKPVLSILPEGSRHQLQEFIDRSLNEEDFRSQFEVKFEDAGEEKFFFWDICPIAQEGSNDKIHVMIGSDTTAARSAHAKIVEFSKDIEVAKSVQSMLLPEDSTIEKSGYSISAYYEPAAQVGGDLWWHKDISDERCFAVVADVMGHGAGSAMLTAALAGTLDNATEYLKEQEQTIDDHKKLFQGVHNVLRKICKGKFFVTAVGMSFCKSDNFADFYFLGCPPGIMFKKDGKRISIRAPGSPLGIQDEILQIGHKREEFEPGDRVVLLTDGCYEFPFNGKEFGRRRATKLFESHLRQSPEAACRNVAMDLEKSRETRFAPDDITFAIIDKKDAAEEQKQKAS